MRALVLVAVAACGSAREAAIPSSGRSALPAHREIALDTTPKHPRRMVPPEAFLRSYLTWFGGLAPRDVEKQARGHGLFEQWNSYIAAMGLPDYQLDTPRLDQSNTIMAASRGRLSEALCFRAAERDLRGGVPIEQRIVFAFDLKSHPSFDDFVQRFDVLHRLFLGYPASLAPRGRLGRFYSLYQQVAANHEGSTQAMSPDETAWASICTVLVQDPEAELY